MVFLFAGAHAKAWASHLARCRSKHGPQFYGSACSWAIAPTLRIEKPGPGDVGHLAQNMSPWWKRMSARRESETGVCGVPGRPPITTAGAERARDSKPYSQNHPRRSARPAVQTRYSAP